MKKRNFVSLLMISTMVLSSMSATMTAVAAESKNDSKTEQKVDQEDAIEGEREVLADVSTRAEEEINLRDVLKNPGFSLPGSSTISEQTGKNVSAASYGWHIYYAPKTTTTYTSLAKLNEADFFEVEFVDTYKTVKMYNTYTGTFSYNNYFPLRNMETGELLDKVGYRPLTTSKGLKLFNTKEGWAVFTQTIDTIPGVNYSLKYSVDNVSNWAKATIDTIGAYNGEANFVGSENLIQESIVKPSASSSSYLYPTLNFVAQSDKTTITVGTTGKGYNQSEAASTSFGMTLPAGGSVTSKYVTTDGVTLASGKTKTYDYRQPYNVEELSFGGYVLKAIEGNPSGLMGTGEKLTVTFIYEKAPGKPVTVNYKDTDGKVLDSVELVGPYGDPWTAEEKEIPGYELVDKPEVTTGIYGDEPVTLEYIYKKLLPGEVLVEYVDEEGISIADSEVLSDLHGIAYTTTAKEFEGFKLKTPPANANGTFDQDKSQTVTYVYERLAGGDITVKYVDKTGKDVAPSETIKGKFGKTYDSNAKAIDGYFLTEEPANAAGTFTMNGQTVTYVYEAQDAAPVTVKYVDQNGKEIAESETVTGKFNDPYKTEQKTITGYEFSGLATGSAPTIGTFTMDTQTVTYQYQAKEAAPVTVRYEDVNGNLLEEFVLPTGLYGEAYTTEVKEFSGYALKTTPENANGVYSMEAQTVTYVYQAGQGQAITVKYINQLGNEIAASTTLSGKVGQKVTAKAKTPSGYELVSESETVEATIGTEEQTIVFEYQGKKAKNVIVYYVDEDGVSVSPYTVVTGTLIGDEYSTEPKTINGYTLAETPENATGHFTGSTINVTYVYKKNDSIPFDLNFVGVQQQKVIGFLPEGISTDKVQLFVKKAGENEWVDTQYSATPDKATGYFAIESRFVKGTTQFLLANQDQVKVVFVGNDGETYEAVQTVQPYQAPVVDDFYEGDEFVTGTVQNGANQVRLNVNDVNQRVVNIGASIVDDRGISARTGEFSIWSGTWHNNPDYYDSDIAPLKEGDTITVDYGVQIAKVNNPSTTTMVWGR